MAYHSHLCSVAYRVLDAAVELAAAWRITSSGVTTLSPYAGRFRPV
jgi:hypothetical protein